MPLISIGNVPEKNDIKKIGKVENEGDLMVGCNVKVLLDSNIHYGVIQWIGTLPGTSPGKLMTAVELVIEMTRLNKLVQKYKEIYSNNISNNIFK